MNPLSKSITTGMLLILSLQVLQAQRYDDYGYYDVSYSKNEIYVLYGAPSFQELSTQIRNLSVQSASGTTYIPSAFSYTGVAAVGYNFYTSPYMFFGLYAGISQASMEMASEKTGNAVYNSTVRSTTGLLSVNWIYFRSGSWELSGQGALGATYWQENQETLNRTSSYKDADTSRWRMAYHLSPFHVRWGGTFGVFADIGWGYRGVANVGLSVRF